VPQVGALQILTFRAASTVFTGSLLPDVKLCYGLLGDGADMTTGTLTKEDALTFAKEWVKDRTDTPKYSSTLSSQKNWLMG
jgi:hypothetical protein